ncbi:sensor histidine kinase [Pedobacter montanisoli]|uniref:histidine kinase n=1 Tax=Pedobacter montanisoli TaxID=2923277 RepID=A0ABS9ZY87_9SPHI|nr:HAMP domain-containing sensor histidine kinase [Pedobacter montanisoli]MCJ0743255.1 HAMP domain-containing histidine kinase [Pedobacter montanisoli]
MQKNMRFVVVLMSCCVLGIVCLQLYWNYRSYKTVTKNFKAEVNQALNNAVNSEMEWWRNQMVKQVKIWLADTSLFTIDCDIKNRDSNTVFTLQDTHPRFLEDTSRRTKFFKIGLAKFTKKLRKITPEAKEIFINHFAEIVFKEDIKKGIVYYYTQGLGDSINVMMNASKVNLQQLDKYLKQELKTKEINSSFTINAQAIKDAKNYFVSEKVNASLRRPFEKEWVQLTLENPNRFYFREMKWIIITSLLLIGITIFSFIYTIKTLLRQQKLVLIKDQFISNMTHEFHTPLSSIQVTTEALERFSFDIETQKQYLEIIKQQAGKLNNLTAQILQNAKLETLGITIQEDIDLISLLNELTEEFGQRTAIDLSFSHQNLKAAIIKGSRNDLKNALSNLLDNAYKYNFSPLKEIRIVLSHKNNHYQIRISDNGIGIPSEFRTKIFEPFFRINATDNHDVKGYGLGLSYVKKIMDLHKASLTVTNNGSKGSIFTIEF